MSSERRSFFRVDDQVLLAWSPIPEVEVGRYRAGLVRADRRADSLRSLLAALDRRLAALDDALREIGAPVHEALTVLNSKLSLLERYLLEAPGGCPEHRLTPVSLSAGGLGLPSAAALAAGSFVGLDLVLLPDYQHLTLAGRVAYCRAETRGYWLAIEFLEVREAEREAIARHVAVTEGAALRAARRGAHSLTA